MNKQINLSEQKLDELMEKYYAEVESCVKAVCLIDDCEPEDVEWIQEKQANPMYMVKSNIVGPETAEYEVFIYPPLEGNGYKFTVVGSVVRKGIE